MDIQVTQILLQIVNFGIIFFILAKLLFKPILKILDARANKIADAMTAAEKSLKELENIEARKSKEMAEAEKKATALVAEARTEAKKAGADLLEVAKADTAKLMASQQAAFSAELEREEKALEGKVAELVVATTKKVLADTLSVKDMETITKKAMGKLK